MPICNEDVAARVRRPARDLRIGAPHRRRRPLRFLRAVRHQQRRPARRGNGRVDRPCRDLDADGRVFYRWRQHRIKRKSGNVADFCRRWGSNYRYMVVLDADSVMTGDCLARLVRLMRGESAAGHHPDRPARDRAATRVFARVQQFATAVYGPLFTAGLHFWQLGESHYWGHNAIIRVAPFMQHCGAPTAARPRAPVRRDPVARLRRGRADAPRGLVGLDRLRPARQLRGDAAEPPRRVAARPSLVPGQPDELPALAAEGTASPRTGPCS